MKLNGFSKLLVGLLTLWPPIYIVLFMGFIALSATGGDFPMDVFPVVAVAHVATMGILLGSLVFYVVHALKNESLEMTPRLLWALMFFVGGFVAMPIYFFMHVLPDAPARPSPSAF